MTFQRRAGLGPKGEARRGGQSLMGLSAFHSLLIFLPLSPRPLGSFLCLNPIILSPLLGRVQVSD